MLTPNDVAQCITIIEQYRGLSESAKAAERALIGHVAAGGDLCPVTNTGTGQTFEYEIVRRVGKKRVWRSEHAVREKLLGEGYALEAFQDSPRLKSVAQLEKHLGWPFTDGLWINPDRGLTILPLGSGLERAEFAKR